MNNNSVGRIIALLIFSLRFFPAHRHGIDVETIVRKELTGWFGPAVGEWRHLKTYRIVLALPEQSPPMPDPSVWSAANKPGIYVCGEYGSVPGLQWALLSGRQAAEQVLRDLDTYL